MTTSRYFSQIPTSDPEPSDAAKGHAGNSTIRAGLVGGLFATLVMTVFRAPIARSLPPTAEALGQYLDGDPEDYRVASLLLHALYGTVGGLFFAPLFSLVVGETDEPETVGLFVGAAYGLVLSILGERALLSRLLGRNLDTDESAVFHAGHLVYGLALGVWTGSRS